MQLPELTRSFIAPIDGAIEAGLQIEALLPALESPPRLPVLPPFIPVLLELMELGLVLIVPLNVNGVCL